MLVLLFNLATAALMVLLVRSAVLLVNPASLPQRRIPWGAVGLTVVAVAGVVVQISWRGAMAALDHDPSRSGWWRPLTATFLQAGVTGTIWNLITLAVLAAFAEWFWGTPLMAALFLTGALLPEHLDRLLGATGGSSDPRNFIGSSGATYFLGATLAGALLLRAQGRLRLLALAVPTLGLATYATQDNAHGLVTCEGFVLGVLLLAVGHRILHFDRDLSTTPRFPVSSLVPLIDRLRFFPAPPAASPPVDTFGQRTNGARSAVAALTPATRTTSETGSWRALSPRTSPTGRPSQL